MSKWISDAYIKRLLQNNRLLQGNCEYELWKQEVEKIVDTMPSIDIEPKRGEWIYGEHDVAMCDGYRCDRCGFFVPWDYEHKSIDFINDYNFCPNCGADMREREGE